MATTLQNEKKAANLIASWAFAAANIAANYESGNLPGFISAIITAAIVFTASRFSKKANLPMQINSIGMALTGIIGPLMEYIATDTVAPDTALTSVIDFLFSRGNWLASKPETNAILSDTSVTGWRKAMVHPATWYSLAYDGTAMLAARFLHAPESAALKAMGIDMAMTLLSFCGLMLNKFKNPAASYMAVTFGAVAGVASGILSGNWLGAINKACSGSGEFSLAYGANANFEEEKDEDKTGQEVSKTTRAFTFLSEVMIFPVRVLRQTIIKPTGSLT